MQKKMKNEKIQGVQAGNMEREQETKEFLKQFYESPEAEEDTIAAKLKRTFVPKGKKTKAIADFAKDLMGEGGAGDVVIDDVCLRQTPKAINNRKRNACQNGPESVCFCFWWQSLLPLQPDSG